MDLVFIFRQGPPSFEEHANFFSRILFLWLNPLLNLGYKRVLNASDLPQLSYILFLFIHIGIVIVQKQFLTRLVTNGLKSNRISDFYFIQYLLYRPNLFKSMAYSFGLPFCLAAILKLIHDICQFVGPVMLEKITIFLSDYDSGLVINQ